MKRLLSIILALAMLISLIPAVFAAGTEAEIKVVYNFTDEETFKKCETYTDPKSGKTGVQIDPTLFTYTTSKGFWEYAANSQDHNPLKSVNGTGVRIDPALNAFQVGGGSTPGKYWIALKLYVPKAGTYNLDTTVNYFAAKSNIYVNAFIFKTESVTSEGTSMKDKISAGIEKNKPIATNAFPANSANTDKTLVFAEPKSLEEGEYYFVFNPTSNTGADVSLLRLLSLTLTENGTGTELVPIISSIDATTENGVTTVKAKAELMSDAVTAAEDATITYSVADNDVSLAKVDANGVVTGIADGTATIIATATKNGQSSSKSIEVVVTAPVVVPEEDEDLSDAFGGEKGDAPSDYIAPSVDVIDANGIEKPVPVSGGAYRITAAETSGDKGNFLYWKKALTTNEKIVSFEREFNYVPEGNERNILVAVYEGDVKSTAPKCYNANGQYLPDTEPIDADLPSMAGYGKATAWAQYDKTNVYVAQYEAETPIADIDVTVSGENVRGGGTDIAYGEEVTCTATGDNFKCWKKTYGDGAAKIVSTEAEYTFNAWEDCTVTAIYEENVYYTGSKLKIIIDSFTAGAETGIMAEFLGLGDNVVEKGIMFEDNRIAMTTVGNQFSVIADEPGTYKGYVIVEEADGFKLITDGSYRK